MTDADKGALNPSSDREGIESSETHYKTSFTAIRKARRFALQGLYSWSLTDLPINEIEAKTRSDNAMHTVHLGYYHELLTQITTQVEQIDALIESAIDRPIAMITKIELAVLRIGVFELKYRLEIPFKVVIDEAIQLNEHFGSDQGYRFINAVMDKLASQLRTLEVTELENQGIRKPKKPYTPKAPRVKKSLERTGISSGKTDESTASKPASSQVRLGRKRVDEATAEPTSQVSNETADQLAASTPEPAKTPIQETESTEAHSTNAPSSADKVDTVDQSTAIDQPEAESVSTELAANPGADTQAEIETQVEVEPSHNPSEIESEAQPATKAKAKPAKKTEKKVAAKPKATDKPKAAAKPRAKTPAKTTTKPAAKSKPKPEAD
jgi:N utilization substance protein B